MATTIPAVRAEFAIELDKWDLPPSYDSLYFKDPTSVPTTLIVQPPQNSTVARSIPSGPESWAMHDSSVNWPSTSTATGSSIRFPVRVVTTNSTSSTSTVLPRRRLRLGQKFPVTKDYSGFIYYIVFFLVVTVIALVYVFAPLW